MQITKQQRELVVKHGTLEDVIRQVSERVMDPRESMRLVDEYQFRWEAAGATGENGEPLFTYLHSQYGTEYFTSVNPVKLAGGIIEARGRNGDIECRGGYFAVVPISPLAYRIEHPTKASVWFSISAGRITLTNDYGTKYEFTLYNVPASWWEEFESALPMHWASWNCPEC